MTKLASLLVSGASNARYAAFLGLDNYLVVEPRALRWAHVAASAARCHAHARRASLGYGAAASLAAGRRRSPGGPRLLPRGCRLAAAHILTSPPPPHRRRLRREGGQHTPGILADVFEALLGALYLDAGWAAADAFCRRVLDSCVDWGQVEADAEDWKGVMRCALRSRCACCGPPGMQPASRFPS